MTPEDLAAIRARNKKHIASEQTRSDVTALLAEVDRLTALTDRVPGDIARAMADAHDLALRDERARIVKMVSEYDTEDPGWFIEHRDNLLRLLGERVEE